MGHTCILSCLRFQLLKQQLEIGEQLVQPALDAIGDIVSCLDLLEQSRYVERVNLNIEIGS